MEKHPASFPDVESAHHRLAEWLHIVVLKFSENVDWFVQTLF